MIFFDFINKNIVDTRYVTKLVLNLLQDFFKYKKNIYPDVKIKTVRGRVTKDARQRFTDVERFNPSNSTKEEKLVFIKNRNNFHHHAVDAAIVSFLGSNEKFKKLFEKNESIHDQWNEEEKLRIQEIFNKMFSKENKDTEAFKDSIKKQINKNEIKFSRAVYSKKNISLFGEKIFETKEGFPKKYLESLNKTNKGKKKNNPPIFLIKKISIFDEKIGEYFQNKKKSPDEKEIFIPKNYKNYFEDKSDLLLLKETNEEYFKLLKEIWNNEKYKYIKDVNNKNHFVNYMLENEKFQKLYENSKTLNKTFIYDENGVKFRISKLRYRAEVKNEPENLFYLDKKNKKGLLDNLKALETRVYCFEKSKKFIPIHVNAHYLKTSENPIHQLEVKEDLILKTLKEKEIKENDELMKNKNGNYIYFKILDGKTIMTENQKVYYFSGLLKLKRIDGIYFTKPVEKNKKPQELTYGFSLSKASKSVQKKENNKVHSTINIDKCYVCDIDELGRIYNKKTFYEYFDERKA